MKLDPVTVLEEKDDSRRAARLGAYMVIQEDRRKENERMKQDMDKAKAKSR